jgi:hypothetical protein
MWALLSELGTETLSLDGKLVRTLRALLVPGRATRLYLDGKRVPFLRPFRLYLLTALALFSSALTLQAPRAEDVNVYLGDELITESPAQLGRMNISLVSSDSRLSQWLADRPGRIEHLRSYPPQLLLDRVFAGMRSMLPLALVAFLPLFAIALKLLLWRTDALYFDHFVFSLHLQSALFLAIALFWLAARMLGAGTAMLVLGCVLTFFAVLGLYLPLAMRRVYRLGVWGTLWRTGLLLVSYFWLLGLSVGVAVSVAVQRL